MTSFFAKLPASFQLGSARIVVVVLEFVVMAYLMRSLGPEPFGLVAMAMSMVIVFEVLTGGGFAASLVSDKNISPKRVGAVLLLSAALALVITVLGILLTPLVVSFYDEEALRYIWIIACLLIGVSVFSAIPSSLAQRNHQFSMLAWPYVPVHILAAVVTWLVLEYRHDYFAILAYRGVIIVVGVFVLWRLVKPVFQAPAKQDMVEVVRFGFGVTASGALNAIQRNSDDVIVGKVLGANALGLYNFAYKVLMFPLREIGGTIDKLAYPRLSSMMPNLNKVGRGLSEVVRETALFTTPFCLAVAFAAEEIITVIFGDAWMGAMIPLVVLSSLGLVQVPASRLGLAFVVSRKTGVMLKWALFSTPFIILSFFVGVQWGITGVVVAYALTSLMLMIPWFIVCARVLQYSAWKMGHHLMTGLLQGFMVSLPLVLAYHISHWFMLSSLNILLVTMFFGGVSLAVTYWVVMQKRRKHGGLW